MSSMAGLWQHRSFMRLCFARLASVAAGQMLMVALAQRDALLPDGTGRGG